MCNWHEIRNKPKLTTCFLQPRVLKTDTINGMEGHADKGNKIVCTRCKHNMIVLRQCWHWRWDDITMVDKQMRFTLRQSWGRRQIELKRLACVFNGFFLPLPTWSPFFNSFTPSFLTWFPLSPWDRENKANVLMSTLREPTLMNIATNKSAHYASRHRIHSLLRGFKCPWLHDYLLSHSTLFSKKVLSPIHWNDRIYKKS